MKIAIGSDHRGVELKTSIINMLKQKGIDCVNCGTDSEESVDYPIIAEKVANAVQRGETDSGILICGTGIGMSIVANKFKKIRCALCYNLDTAKFAKLHNNANIIALGASQLSQEDAIKIVEVWIDTEFEGKRHEKRINMISEIEKQNMK